MPVWQVLGLAARLTEGFVAADLVQLAEGARLGCARRRLLGATATATGGGGGGGGEVGPLQLCADDVNGALRHVTPAERGGGKIGSRLSLEAGGNGHGNGASGGWSSVGGLERVKRVLMEAVLLPREHPELFAASPLRLTSGVRMAATFDICNHICNHICSPPLRCGSPRG